MTGSTGDARTLRQRQVARADWLAEMWDEIRPKYEDNPEWLRRLATQLELWVGDELDDADYLEASYAPVPDETFRESGGVLLSNALNSDTLYLRALTATQFVTVDIRKASGQVAVATVLVDLIPRSHLESLQATEMTMVGTQPDTMRLILRYAGRPEPFLIPHAEDYDDRDRWLKGEDLRVFGSLRDDLRSEAVATGKPVIEVR